MYELRNINTDDTLRQLNVYLFVLLHSTKFQQSHFRYTCISQSGRYIMLFPHLLTSTER